MKREKALEAIIVLALASLFVYIWRDISWLIYVSAGLLVLPLISKKATIIIAKGWFAFSNYVGVVMNHIILFIIFYLFLVPLSFFQKLTGKNQILKKSNPHTNFDQRNHLFVRKDIEHPW